MTQAQRPPSIDALAGADGSIVGVAVDHRDSFRAALRAAGIADFDDALIADIKTDIVQVLAPAATVVLVDGEIGLPAVQARGALPSGLPFAMPLEAQGYGALHDVGHTRLLDEFGPADAAAAGASACKLLLPIRVDLAEQAVMQVEVARTAVSACHAAGLPLILEPVVWSAPDESLDADRFASLVIDAVRLLAPLRPGLLKVQYPGSAAACGELHGACAGHPWVLLGGGESLDDLERHVRDACAAGSRGCIVGRSLFAAALGLESESRRRELETVSLPALKRLRAATA